MGKNKTNKTNKTTNNSINYDVAYESSLSIENHEGILVTHSTALDQVNLVFETDLEQKKSKWLQGHFPLGLHFYSFRIGFRISLELRSHDLIFVKTNFIPIVSAIKLQKVECLG